MHKLEPVSRQISNGSGGTRVPLVLYDDPYEEPPAVCEFSSASGVSQLSQFSAATPSAVNSFDSRGPGDGASARRDFPLSLPSPQNEDADDDGLDSVRLVRGGDRQTVPNPSVGNYDEPWDLFSKRRELEDQLRAMPNFAFKVADRPEPVTQLPNFAFKVADRPEPVTRSTPQSTDDGRPFTEGYDRPWDLQPHKRDGRDDEGYDKPWDLKPHEKDLRASVAAVGEYDAPWDIKPRILVERELIAAKSAKDAAAAVQGAARSSVAPVAKAPVDADTRPAVEYDEPWDQKKKQLLNKAVSEVKDSSPLPVAQPRSSVVKPVSSIPVGEKIDPKLPLEQQCWYHGSISRIDAEGLLRIHREGSYLVRTSESNRKDYSLSVKSSRGFMHMKIVTEILEGGGTRYILGQFSQPFSTIPLMIHNYTVNKLPIKGAEHTCLLYPVSHELL